MTNSERELAGAGGSGAAHFLRASITAQPAPTSIFCEICRENPVHGETA
jgi:hypothetical protein